MALSVNFNKTDVRKFTDFFTLNLLNVVYVYLEYSIY